MNLSPTTWRLICSPPARGAWNMAIDEAILEAAGRGEVLPALRLYAWEPACLSLGYAQPVSDVDFSSLEAHGWDLVRRPTGGRAILHTDELTYSVAGPASDPRLAGSVLESYQRLSQALLAALRLLDIPAESREQPANAARDRKGPVCFEVPSNYEITFSGKKLIGSAQARRKGGVLQHGSLPLYGDLGSITQALAFASPPDRERAAARLQARAATAEEILGAPLDWERAAQAFRQAFSQVLNLELLPAEITPGELARAQELLRDKYAHPEWTNRV